MKEKNFEKIGDLLSSLISKKGWEKHLAPEKLKKDWPSIVGENIAQHSVPVSIVQQKLFVEVDTSIWANQLNFLKIKIISTINDYYKNELVKEIFFKIKNNKY